MKRIFYISDQQLNVYHWYKNQCIASYSFQSDAHGYHTFEHYLTSIDNLHSRILLDLSDEEFITKTIPHVGFHDRKSILSRLINKHYPRQKHYINSAIIGREHTGRKDDILRICALRKTQTLEPWLELIEKSNTLVSEVLSLPVLSPSLTPKLTSVSTGILLISQQNRYQLRLTFIKSNQVIHSRIHRIQPRDKSISELLPYEAEQTCFYLLHQKIISKDEVIPIHILCSDEDIDKFQYTFQTTEHISYHFHSINTLSKQLNFFLEQRNKQHHSHHLYADFIFSHICDSAPSYSRYLPFNLFKHYGKPSLFKPFYYLLYRRLIYAASSFFIILSIIISLHYFTKSLSLTSSSMVLSAQARSLHSHYSKTFKPNEETLIKAQAMQSSVLFVDAVKNLKTISPLVFMSTLSHALQPFNEKQFQINQLSWKQFQNPNPKINLKKTSITSGYLLNPNATQHYARIQAYLTKPSDTLKENIKYTYEVESKLQQNLADSSVKLVKLPFDIHASINFEANPDKKEPLTNFTLQIIMPGLQP